MTDERQAALAALPERVVVGANGAYWRDYGTHYSICPVSEDNDPVEVVAVYVRAEAATLDVEAVLEVAKLADDGAFLCDFGGRLSVNLPNLERVVLLAREYRDGGAA